MKKIILSLTVLGLVAFTSCKKEAENAADATTDAVEEVTDATTDAVEEVADATTDAVEEVVTGVPQFEDAKVQEYVDTYNAYFKEVKEATESGNTAKLEELQGKAVEMTTKLQELTQGLSAEDAQKLTEWQASLAGQ